MRLIDPTRTRVSTERTEHGTVTVTDHHNGSRDATVKIRSLVIKPLAGAPDKQHVEAIMELQAATREHRLAKEADSPDWLRYTTARLRDANVRISEVQ